MAKLKDESFQAVSRGLLMHLSEMSNAQAKLYLFCLLKAKNQGKDKGSFSGFAVDIADALGWMKPALYNILKSMAQYLDINYQNNRHHPMVIKILKFKALPDFYRTQNEHGKTGYCPPTVQKNDTVTRQYLDGNLCNSNKEKGLPSPKKVNKLKRQKEINTCLIFLDFWEMYQKKTGRKKVELKYSKISEVDRELIKGKLPAYVRSTPDVQYRKNPETWLNQECWNDDIIQRKESPDERTARLMSECGLG